MTPPDAERITTTAPRTPGESAADRGAFAPERMLEASAALGALCWVGLVLSGTFDLVSTLFLATPLVLVPAGIRLVATPRRDGSHVRTYRAVAVLQPVGAATALVSLALEAGPAAGALSLPWLLVTGLAGAVGAWRLLPRGPVPIEELAIDAGLLYLPVGGAWFVASAFGLSVLTFDPLTILFAAVHFHFAGFALLVLAGLSGRLLEDEGRARSAYRVVTPGVVFGPGLIGIGITASPFVEVVAVVVLTVAVSALAATVVWGVVDARTRRFAVTAPFAAGWLAVGVSMGFALSYGVAKFTGDPIAGIGQGTMIDRHGQLNVTFALLVTGALWLARPGSRAVPPGIPFSRLRADGRVGRDFLERRGARDSSREATGMVDAFADLEGPRLNPDAVNEAVRDAYERTGSYALAVRPQWRRGTGPLRWLMARLGPRTGQLNVPIADEGGDLEGTVFAVDDDVDGRTNVRTWSRWYDDGTAMYVATYAVHEHEGTRYLNAAFPLPWATLTGVLRPESDGVPGAGFELSTLPSPDAPDDAGLYLTTRFGSIRLPLDERLRLWAVDDPSRPADIEPDSASAAVVARHDVWLAGVRILTLEYDLEPR